MDHSGDAPKTDTRDVRRYVLGLDLPRQPLGADDLHDAHRTTTRTFRAKQLRLTYKFTPKDDPGVLARICQTWRFYLQSLDRASIDLDIESFAAYVAGRLL